MDFKELVKTAEIGAIKTFTNDGEVMQVALAVNRHDEMIAIACPWSDPRERRVILDALKTVFATHGVKHYVVISEVWTLEQRRGDAPVLPSESERRRECVMVAGTDGKERVLITREILRAPGRPPILDEPLRMTQEQCQGELMELIPAVL